MRTLLALATALLPAIVCAEQLDVDLKTGEHLFGILVSIDADELVLKRSLWNGHRGTITASQTISRLAILAMHPVDSLEDDYRAHAASSGNSYAARYSLARWCLDRGLTRHAADIALALAAEEKDDAVTADLLGSIGYLRVGGAWVERDAYALAHHLVDYDGVLMSREEAAARTEYANAQLAIRETQLRLGELEAFERTTLLELRDATIALRRAERHQREQRADAEQARVKSMTPDQIADEQEQLAFDRQHGIAEPVVPDVKEVVDARAAATVSQNRYDHAQSDLSVAKASLAQAQAVSAEAAARVSSLSGAPFPPGPAGGAVAPEAPAARPAPAAPGSAAPR